MAGVVTTRLLEALAEIGVDVSKKQPSNVKTLATKNKSSATKVGLLAAERDTGGNFGTVLDIFKKEAQFIDGMNDVEKMAFLNNIMDYKEFGGKSIKVSEGIKLKDEFDKGLGTLKDDIESLQSTAKTMKDDAEKGLASAEKDLKDFIDTGGQPLKAKSDKYLGGSMHEEGQLRTAIRTFLRNEYKNGRIKLDKDDEFRIMEYSPMMEDDPIKVFKKIYGDEAYTKAGTFPGAFEKGENFNHYETIFKENMGEDILKVKDKKYVGDGTLTLTKQEEVFEPTKLTEDDVEPFAKGGRASFVGGKIVDELVAMLVKKEPMDAMKEVNKIIGKKGKYKNLTQEDINRIVDQTNDHIFQRDPDNLYVGNRDIDNKKRLLTDDEIRDYEAELGDSETWMMDGTVGEAEKALADSNEYTAAMKKEYDAASPAERAEVIGKKNVDDMSLEESLTTLEGLGATKMAERFKLKQKYPGLDDDLLTNIIEDTDPVHKASVLAKIDMAMELGKTNKSADEIIDILKKEPETKMATGGRAGYSVGSMVSQASQASEGIESRLDQLGGDVTSAEKTLQQINERLQSAGSSVPEGGGLGGLLGGESFGNAMPATPIGTPEPSLTQTVGRLPMSDSNFPNNSLGGFASDAKFDRPGGPLDPGRNPYSSPASLPNNNGYTFRAPTGDYGRYVADNDPGQQFAGYSSYQDYIGAGNDQVAPKLGPQQLQSTSSTASSNQNLQRALPGLFATGGRAGFYMGGQSGQSVIEPDLSDIGHGSDALMSRTRLTAPGSQATTSTGLNYLLGEDNDNTRVPFNKGLLVPPKKPYVEKPYTTDMFQDDSMTLLQGMYGTGKDSNEFLYNEMIKKGNKLREKGVERETVIEIIRNNKDKIDMILKQQTGDKKSLAGLADGGRAAFQDGLTVEKNPTEIFQEKVLEKIKNDEPKEKDEQAEMFKTVKEFQKFKENNPNSRMSFFMFRDIKKKEKELFKNKIITLDLKYPEKQIIDKKTNMVNKENLKSAIDEAEANLEISPIDGLNLKRSINTEGEQSSTSGSFNIGNFNFSSPNLEEGKLTSGADFKFGNLDLSGMVDSKDSNILNTELGFNYDNMLKGKMKNSDGYRSTELDLNKSFPISDNINFDLKGSADTKTFNDKTYKSSDLTPKLSYDDGILNASISKEIMEGGDVPNLGAGVKFNDFYAKGDNLLSEDRSGVLGYQKEFGDSDGSAFFTIGGEIDPFTGDKTGGAGFKYKFADGGITGLRQGYAGGKGVDIARRGFLKFLGGTAAGVVALKAGLVKMFGKESGAVSKKAIDEVIIEGGSGAPAWLQPLVNKALREGKDISQNAIKDGQTVKSLDTPTGKVDVYYDARTGEIDIDYIGGNTALGESVNMRYVPGIADEGTKGVKPMDEFEAVEAIPEYQGGNPLDGPSLEVGENITSDVKGLYSDTSELAELGGQKTLTKDIVETVKKKKILKKMENEPADFITDEVGIYDPT